MGKAHSNPNNRKILTKYLKLLVGQGRVMTCPCKKKNQNNKINKQTIKPNQKNPQNQNPKPYFCPSEQKHFLYAWTFCKLGLNPVGSSDTVGQGKCTDISSDD